MGTFTMTHEIDCSVETFWKIFFDPEYNTTLFKDELRFPKWVILEYKESDTEIFRKIDGQPRMDAPAVVAKALGPSFGYVEDGTFDKKTEIFRFKMKTSVMSDKLTNFGSVRVEKIGDKRCRRVVEITAEAKVFGIGGVIEKVLENSFRTGWQHSAEFIGKWVKDKGL
jgi:hypothetical protein